MYDACAYFYEEVFKIEFFGKLWKAMDFLKNYGKHSLRYQGPHIWSKLDVKLKGSSNIESFKTNIRKKDLTSLLNNNNSCCNLCNS